MIKVAIDSGPLDNGHSVRGIGTYVSEVVKATRILKNKGIVVDAIDFSEDPPFGYDILHFTFLNPYFVNFPKNKRCKWITTVHDLIPLIYKDNYAPGIKGSIRLLLNKYYMRKMDGIIAVSETTKKDLVRLMGVPANKINVIYEAPKTIFSDRNKNPIALQKTSKKYNLPQKFILYVGDVNYNKNLGILVKASKMAKIPLVICGKQATEIENSVLGLHSLVGPKDYIRYLFGKSHPEQAHYGGLLKMIEGNKLVRRLGYVEDSDLSGIYKLASVCVQPSLYEGFGLPLVEAMSSATPTVISRTQALVEISDGSSLVADPHNAQDFSEKIKNVLTDPGLRDRLIKAGLKRSKEFSWAKTAEQTISYYREVAKY
jgi:glycosyltransferase involved in cell wall biosynthesis